MNRLCCAPSLLEGMGISGGCSRSLPDDFEFLSTEPSAHAFNHSSMSHNRSPDAISRNRSPDAEFLFVPAEPCTDTGVTSSLVTPGATVGTKVSDLPHLLW